jgi:2-polyprenyl-3-methyl-5-hydroxy-6-metoxy-1,4-benzoquinol methylase
VRASGGRCIWNRISSRSCRCNEARNSSAYASSHQSAQDAIPAGASVIDIGAGPGGIARELVKKGCKEPTFDVRGYDYLLLLDIIEHLQNTERFLDHLRVQFDYSPRTVAVTTPMSSLAFSG